jgi:hypothetical protein
MVSQDGREATRPRRARGGRMSENYNANFLWPHPDGSIEQAGYEFANAQTVDYQISQWEILIDRIESGQEEDYQTHD